MKSYMLLQARDSIVNCFRAVFEATQSSLSLNAPNKL